MRKQKGRRRRPRKDPRTKPVLVSISAGRALAETINREILGRWNYNTGQGDLFTGVTFTDHGDWFAAIKQLGNA